MEVGVERPSCDVVAVVAAQRVGGMPKVAPDIEGSRIPVAFAPELGCRYDHVAHGSAMTPLTLENLIVEYGRLVAGMVFAACGQPPSYRVLLIDLVSLPGSWHERYLNVEGRHCVPAEENCPDMGVL